MVKKGKNNTLKILAAGAAIYFLFFRGKSNSFNMSNLDNIQSNYAGAERNNISILNQDMKNAGITNRIARVGILAVCGKESTFIPKNETCYNNTSNSRIRSIFPTRTGALSDTQLSALKSNCTNFFNFVYDNRDGNGSGDGYKYRGRGYNGLTFRSNYRKIGEKIGVNLEQQPELINQPEIASKSLIAYMLDRANSSTGRNLLQQYGYNNINEITNLDFAVRFFANCNAGLGNSFNGSRVTEAFNKSKPFVPKVYSLTI
jgi:predicted chitinase